MSVIRTYVWTTRAKCSCGYFWTTPGSSSVVCACALSAIIDNVVMDGDQVADDVAFKAAVAADLGLVAEVVTLVQGG